MEMIIFVRVHTYISTSRGDSFTLFDLQKRAAVSAVL